jgi:uncharacterized membrane protein YjdF
MISTNWGGYRKAAWVGIALLAVAIVVVIIQRNWLGLGFLTGFLIASIVFVRLERKLPTLFDLIFVVAALINAGGCAWNLYNKPGPYDEIAHFFTIFAITLSFGFLLFRELMSSFAGHRVLFIITIASFGIAIGALWEIIEWSADFVIPQQIVSGLFDTVTDLILDSLGATLAAFLNLWGLHELANSEAATGRQSGAHAKRGVRAAAGAKKA